MSNLATFIIPLLQAAFILKNEAANAIDPNYKSVLEKAAYNVNNAATEIERLLNKEGTSGA